MNSSNCHSGQTRAPAWVYGVSYIVASVTHPCFPGPHFPRYKGPQRSMRGMYGTRVVLKPLRREQKVVQVGVCWMSPQNHLASATLAKVAVTFRPFYELAYERDTAECLPCLKLRLWVLYEYTWLVVATWSTWSIMLMYVRKNMAIQNQYKRKKWLVTEYL